MTSFGDSEPVFRDRAKSAGLADEVVQLIVDAGFKSLSTFAFSSAYIPGSGDDTSFVKTIKTAIAREPTLGELASCRKLLHEAYALVTAEMKQQLERTEDVQTRKLTQPERVDLYSRQAKRLTGLSLKGPLEPSDSLIDTFCGIYESNRLKFVPWEKYTSKESEIDKELKAEHMFALDAAGQLKLEKTSSGPVADTSSEIMLQFALQRRGLAMDQSNLLEYSIHQKWVDRLIKARILLPPPGYSKPSFRQLLDADKKLFEELSDETRTGVQFADKSRPLDLCFETCVNRAEVMHYHQPMLAKHPDSKSTPPMADKKPGPYKPSGKGKGKSSKGGKSKQGNPRMPAVLVEGGCRASTNKGEPICFGYNLGTCVSQVSNGKCDRGLHVCALPRCGKHHLFISCPTQSSGS